MCLVTRYKGFLTKKGLQIMMSSLLNVSNGSSKSEKFSLNDIEVLFDSDGENWCLSRDLTPKKCPKEMILRQWSVILTLSLGLRINKVRRISSFQSIGSCVSS